MFSSGDFEPLTKLVLVNAIYFRGEWKYKFSPDATHPQDFRVKKGNVTKIPMMHLQTATKIGNSSVQEKTCSVYSTLNKF